MSEPIQYVVLGMHRSGTSMVAHILHQLGIFMGDAFLEPDEMNPGGYWEDKDFLKLNKRILAHLGGDWSSKFSRKEVLAAQPIFEDEIKTLIAKRCTDHDQWGWKDPRTSLLTWLYHEHLPNPRYIVLRRDRTKIVASLERCHGGDPVYWGELADYYWLHIRDFLSSTPDVKYYQVDYWKMTVNQQNGTLLSLLEFLGRTESDLEKAREVIEYK